MQSSCTSTLFQPEVWSTHEVAQPNHGVRRVFRVIAFRVIVVVVDEAVFKIRLGLVPVFTVNGGLAVFKVGLGLLRACRVAVRADSEGMGEDRGRLR